MNRVRNAKAFASYETRQQRSPLGRTLASSGEKHRHDSKPVAASTVQINAKKGDGMEDKMQKRIREQHLGIKGTNRLILTEMLIEANKDRCVSISRSELAKRANCSKRAVQKAYRLFQEHGLVLLEQKGTGRTTYIWRFIEVLNCERCGESQRSPLVGSPGENKQAPQGSLSVLPIMRVPVKIFLGILLMMTPTVFSHLLRWYARTSARLQRTYSWIYFWNLQRASSGSPNVCTGAKT